MLPYQYATAQELVAIVRSKDWYVEEIADELGVTRRAVTYWATGSVRPSTRRLKELRALATKLTCDDYAPPRSTTVRPESDYEMELSS